MTQSLRSTPALDTNRNDRVERFEVIVIGAGQAGLAVGYHLAQEGSDFVILDGASRVGESWRTRWDSLRLFTPAKYDGLPGMNFPAAPGHLPDKDEVADYLERYAERFDLPVRLETPVESLRWNGARYEVRAGGRLLEAESVVVATGPFQQPRIPAFASQLNPRIVQLHSRDYRTPFALPEGPVLVVGAGNSGAQVAMEVANVRRTWLAGRDTGYLPRRVLGRDLFDWIWPFIRGVTRDTRLGRRIMAGANGGGDALIGISRDDIAASGVTRVGRVEGVHNGLPTCDGAPLQPASIIWCTGFTADYRWIHLPIFGADGYPVHERGLVPSAPGLYFIGLRLQHRISSSLLGGVRDDAAWIAQQVIERAGVTEPV